MFLVANPIVFAVSPFAGGWLLVVEFTFTLAMALKCYPLQPGGLLAIEAIAIGIASPDVVFDETKSNFTVILLLISWLPPVIGTSGRLRARRACRRRS